MAIEGMFSTCWERVITEGDVMRIATRTATHATRCNTPQHTATLMTRYRGDVIRVLADVIAKDMIRIVMHCNTLQYAATHCNTHGRL